MVGAATAAAGPGGRVSHGSKERKNRQAVAGGCSMKGDVVCVYSTGPKQPGRGPPAGGHQLAVCRLTGGAVGTHGAALWEPTGPLASGRPIPPRLAGATASGPARRYARRRRVGKPPRRSPASAAAVQRTPPKACCGNRHGHRVLLSAAAPLSLPPVPPLVHCHARTSGRHAGTATTASAPSDDSGAGRRVGGWESGRARRLRVAASRC